MDTEQLAALHQWFDRFVSGFSGATPADQRNYDLKVMHTREVCAIMGRLTASLGLTAAEQRLAEAVALCHDVGRFPQYRQYRTFNDPVSVNHAALAVETLQQETVVQDLPTAERELLLQAVALHNVFQLPGGLRPELRRLVLLIRDADKLDIWRVLIEHCTAPAHERASAVTWELPVTGNCSPRALEEVMARRMVNRSLLATADDFKLLQLSWVFDLHFREAFAILTERDYIETLAALLPPTAPYHAAATVVRNFVRERKEQQACVT
jgi:hypothetical protein